MSGGPAERMSRTDQDDAYECNINGEALGHIGQALGIYAPPSSTEESDSDADDAEDAHDGGRKGVNTAAKLTGRNGPAKSTAAVSSSTEDAAAAGGGKDDGKGDEKQEDGLMPLGDIAWWLMMFPFYEKEFDMIEVVASSAFGAEEEDGDDSDDEEEEGEGEGEGDDVEGVEGDDNSDSDSGDGESIAAAMAGTE